ncbi:DNA polymerase III subunit chi [Methylobacter sp.]|uniref:DNA polymerase III subunit chi n=1 Tax=Methylobacter sp. TaxID=2051955 RepID=UPI002489AC1A|nr:DNA polymerase III subunit chi [Methylobacter sp.]MDI1279570.1 DNA polymerase III subunit chi [Methylobacter sp.]MDI1360299.1 DNA polymerase III subunit chi [Methylobacter sp.]
MAEVSFYILPSESLEERYLFACKLIEKAYRSGSFCYVLTDSAEQSRTIDDLLWTFRAGSFIPHQIYTGEPPDIARDGVYVAGSPGASAATEKVILIGSLDAPERWQKVLFNLSSRYPDVGPQTERILEILDNSETTKEAGRNRYRRYQQSGMPVTTHKDW